MLIFNKYFYKNKKSKLYFGDRVAVLNDFIYQTGGSTMLNLILYIYLYLILKQGLLLPLFSVRHLEPEKKPCEPEA
jgi:hypothetical protein